MKAYRILPVILLVTAFQPEDNLGRYPKCGIENDCYYQKPVEDPLLIERQEEESFEDIEVNNKKLEEAKRNAEQPGLNKEGP